MERGRQGRRDPGHRPQGALRGPHRGVRQANGGPGAAPPGWALRSPSSPDPQARGELRASAGSAWTLWHLNPPQPSQGGPATRSFCPLPQSSHLRNGPAAQTQLLALGALCTPAAGARTGRRGSPSERTQVPAPRQPPAGSEAWASPRFSPSPGGLEWLCVLSRSGGAWVSGSPHLGQRE